MKATAQATLLKRFILIEKDIRSSKNLKELGFTICNKTHSLVNYDQAILFTWVQKNPLPIAASATIEPDPYSPYLKWLTRVIQYLNHRIKTPTTLTSSALPKALQEDWKAWLPEEAIWCPIYPPHCKKKLGGLWLARHTKWTANEIQCLSELSEVYGHTWKLLYHERKRWYQLSSRTAETKHAQNTSYAKRLIIALSILLVLLLPVHRTVLAPAEVFPDQPSMITSPMAGVIETIQVRPNQQVAPNQVLFQLDPLDIQSRYELADNALKVAKEKYRKASQHAFSSPTSKSELAVLRAEITTKTHELSYITDLLKRITVRAPTAGIAVFSDVNDWIGKPVAVGERVMLIAHPDAKSLKIEMPANQAITLKTGSKIRFYPNTAPLSPIKAELTYASYSAFPSQNGTLSYLVKGQFNPNANHKDTDPPHWH